MVTKIAPSCDSLYLIAGSCIITVVSLFVLRKVEVNARQIIKSLEGQSRISVKTSKKALKNFKNIFIIGYFIPGVILVSSVAFGILHLLRCPR
jgi:hypothetical protein